MNVVPPFKVNLLKGIDNCSGAALKAVRQLWTPILVTIFLISTFKNSVGRIWFTIQIFLKIMYTLYI